MYRHDGRHDRHPFVTLVLLSEIVNYLGQVRKEVKWDKQAVSRAYMYVELSVKQCL